MAEHISMVHGSGGIATASLIQDIFAKEYQSSSVDAMEDAAVLGVNAGRIAVTTDSFVVKPLFYPGGNIGRLAVCGTVNDLLARGARPKYLTSAFILEEGASLEELRKVARSLAETATEAGVEIVCGDTKVIEGNGGIMINTTGVGFVDEGVEIAAAGAKDGDAILVSGTMGDHHATILSCRLSIENSIISDNAPLVEMVEKLMGLRVRTMRDATRGGLATVLSELAEVSGKDFYIDEESIPVSEEVRDFCGIMGLDPLYMGNEGKMVVVVDAGDAEAALAAMRKSRYGENAAVIGEVGAGDRASGNVLGAKIGHAFVRTAVGGLRRLAPLQDEGLPRIC